MREIKFRAWDKENKEMYDVELLGEKVIKLKGAEWENVEDFIIMQYTGLKDKNGKEIYEGDILRDTDDEIYYIGFIRGCFYLKTNYVSSSNSKWDEWLPMCEMDRLAEAVDFEVIGNIYENPQLLKEE